MNVVLYARYSTDMQTEDSIEAQTKAIKEYCKKNKYTLIDSYIDRGISAKTDDRPKFLQMINDSINGQFNAIIVHKLDRFARNRYDSAFYRKKLKENGVKLVSVLENLDDSPESVILESVLEGMAEFYSKNLAREVLKVLNLNASKSKFNGGVANLGYDIDPSTKQYVINEFEAQAVRKIFSMYLQGRKYDDIIKELTDMGIKSKKGTDIKPNTLHDILKNPKYKGTYFFNRGSRKSKRGARADTIYNEGAIPQIISEDDWNQVQESMSKRSLPRATKKAKTVYLLSNLIFCECGSKYHGDNGGDNYYYYKNRFHTCEKKVDRIRREVIEGLVVDCLINNILSDNHIKKIVQDFQVEYLSLLDNNKDEIDITKKEIRQKETEINNIMNAIKAGIFTITTKKELELAEAKKEELETKLIKLSTIKDDSNMPPGKAEYLLHFIKLELTNNERLEEIKPIIQQCVEKIVVHDNTFEIYYTIPLPIKFSYTIIVERG
ncbi:MAG: recombinase family protein [Deltaproteobacteria bacterium]